MSSNELKIPKPSFDNIKNELKEFLKKQDTLKDYNFDGSIINTMLDVLAYNSYFNMFYNNMVSNEAFIDTAQKRHNIIRLASNYGYSPVSSKSSILKCYVEYEYTNNEEQPSEMVIPFGTTFITDGLTRNFTFTLLDDVILQYDNTKDRYTGEIILNAGKLFTQRFSVSDEVDSTIYNINKTMIYREDLYTKGITIDNNNVDTDTLLVYVDGVLYNSFNRFDLPNVDTDDNRLYHITENILGKTCIVFDKLFSSNIQSGKEIKVVYLSTYADDSNGVYSVKPLSSIDGFSNRLIRIDTASGGGTPKESNDSIRINAKRHFESQGRLVTVEDYKYAISQIYPNARSVFVWGGQDNNPPIYGKVFISVLPQHHQTLTNNEKDRLLEALNKNNIITIKPEIIDVNYLKVNIDSLIYYKQSQLEKPIGEVMTTIRDRLNSYSSTRLNKHFNILEYSKLTSIIDSVDVGIIGNETNISLTVDILLNYNNALVKSVYEFDNELQKDSLTSGLFNYGGFNRCFFKEYGETTVNNTSETRSVAIYSKDVNGNNILIVSSAGLIDYKSGKLILDGDLKFMDGKQIKVTVKPIHNVIKTSNNTILTIDNIKLNHKVM